MGFMECILVGSILSSTDPVSILSIFQQLNVDPKLYSLIFGESILNDSVAIVLFNVLRKMKSQPFYLSSVFIALASFVTSFLGSLIIGVIFGLLSALMLKYTLLMRYSSLETSLLLLLAYASYLLSNAIELSGIVSLLFCGITMKHYTFDNMSYTTQQTTKYMFRVLSQLTENFIFIYLGVAIFTEDGGFYPILIILTIVSSI